MKTKSFDEVFRQLSDILVPYASAMVVKADEPGLYHLNAPKTVRGKEVFFAYLKMGKAYVSYHLVPLYDKPELMEGASPELRKRMQGKTCFNFRTVDDALFLELKDLTYRSFQYLSAQGYVA